MPSGFWYKGIILTAVLSCLLHKAMADCSNQGSDEDKRCDRCYQTLLSFLVNTSDNKYHLQKTFYPPDRISPAFVKVIYQYDNLSITNQTWYWSIGSFYFYQPLRLLQDTSLFFGNPTWQVGSVTITLPTQCRNAPEEFMEQLTQKLKLYANWQNANPCADDTYHANAVSLSTLRGGSYPDPYDHTNIPALLYCFQLLFPFFTTTLILIYILIPLICGCSFKSLKEYAQKHTKEVNSWAIVFAYTLLCVAFTVYVFALDVSALVARGRGVNTTEYFTEEYDASLFHYPGTVFAFDLLGILIVIILAICTLLLKEKMDLDKHATLFLCLNPAGIAPLLCLASHTHYILIAWLTDPIYASSIGISYAIAIFVYLFLLKEIYQRVTPKNGDAVSCKAVIAMVIVFLNILVLQTLFTFFYIRIPMNHSIQNTPNIVYTILHGTEILILALVSYKVFFEPYQHGSYQPMEQR